MNLLHLRNYVRVIGHIAALGAFLAVSPANSYGAGVGCDAFKWPLTQEAKWFKADTGATILSGTKFDGIPDKAISLALEESSSLHYVMPPEQPSKPGMTKGTIVSFGKVSEGTYQITISEEGWLDVIEGGAFQPSAEHTGVTGCTGLRKSVRFKLSAGELTIQVSNAAAAQVLIAIRKIQ